MDKLDELIHDKQREINELGLHIADMQRRLDLAQAQLAAYEEAAAARPTIAAEIPTRRGRQPGAISMEWREVLAIMASHGEPYTYGQITDIANRIGLSLDIASVRDRVRSFMGLGFLIRISEDGFIVTEDAINRFGLPSEARNRKSHQDRKRWIVLDKDGDIELHHVVHDNGHEEFQIMYEDIIWRFNSVEDAVEKFNKLKLEKSPIPRIPDYR